MQSADGEAALRLFQAHLRALQTDLRALESVHHATNAVPIWGNEKAGHRCPAFPMKQDLR
jgi:hypothetical protein